MSPTDLQEASRKLLVSVAINGSVVVPVGASCIRENVIVTGNFTGEDNAVLVIGNGSMIEGNVTGSHCDFAAIEAVDGSGDVVIAAASRPPTAPAASAAAAARTSAGPRRSS